MAVYVYPAFEQKLQRLFLEALTDACRVREIVAEVGAYALDDGRHIATFWLPLTIEADGTASITLSPDAPNAGYTILDLYTRSDAGLGRLSSP